MNLTETQVLKFEKLSGWKTKRRFEGETGGYLTSEHCPKTNTTQTFLWRNEDSPEPVASMWFAGQHFYKHGH